MKKTLQYVATLQKLEKIVGHIQICIVAARYCQILGTKSHDVPHGEVASKLEILKQTISATTGPGSHAFENMRVALEQEGVVQQIESDSGSKLVVADAWVRLATPPVANEKVMILTMDGGPDRNIRFPRAILAMMTLQILSGVDTLVAFNTAANHSQRNLVERAMALINLRLAGVGLERGKMSAASEEAMHQCGSVGEVRQRIAEAPQLAKELVDAMAPCLEVLRECTDSRVPGEASSGLGREASGMIIATASPSTPFELSVVSHFAQVLFGVDLHAKVVRLPSPDVLEKHLKTSYYMTQVRKCGEASCGLCSRLRGHMHQWLPLPMPLPADPQGSGYAPFDKAVQLWNDADYGDHERRHRPGHKSGKEFVTDADKRRSKTVPLTGQNVRMAYQCCACGKSRCIFSKRRLGEMQASEARKAIAAELQCGDPLFSSEHPLYDEVFAKEGITCNATIQSAYYAALEKTALRTELIWPCSFCGVEVGTAADAASSPLLRPLCQVCQSCGLNPVARTGTRALPKFFGDIVADAHASDDEGLVEEAQPAGDGSGPKTGYRIFMSEPERVTQFPEFKARAKAWKDLPCEERASYEEEGRKNRKINKEARKRKLPSDLATAVSHASKKPKDVEKSPEEEAVEAAEPKAKHSCKPPTFFEQPLDDYKCVGDNRVRIWKQGAHEGAEFSGFHVEPDEVFQVTQILQSPIEEARWFYQLADGRGWVSNVSRKDPTKIVVVRVSGSSSMPSAPAMSSSSSSSQGVKPIEAI